MFIMLSFYYQQDCHQVANCQYYIYSEAENQHFRPTGVTHCIAFHVKFGMAEGHVGPIGYVKFHANLCMELERSPQIQKFPLFGKESPHRGEPFDGFLQVLGAYMRPIALH